MSDLYHQSLEAEIVTGSAEGFERGPSRQLRDLIQGGRPGEVTAYLLSLIPEESAARAKNLEAFMDCLIERRAFSHVQKRPVTRKLKEAA